MAKKKVKTRRKRVPAAVTRFVRNQSPKMKGVTHVRVRKLKGGGVSITPAARKRK